MAEDAYIIIDVKYAVNCVPTHEALVHNLVPNIVEHVEMTVVVCQDKKVTRCAPHLDSLMVELV